MSEQDACIGCISRETCSVLRSHHGYWECESWYPGKNQSIEKEQKK